MSSGRRVRRRAGEAGFATVWAVGWIAVLLSLTWTILLLAVAVARQHHLDGAADLVALSAARTVQDGGDGCVEADRMARINHVTLAQCVREGEDVVVQVVDSVTLPVGWTVRLEGRARAGPSG